MTRTPTPPAMPASGRHQSLALLANCSHHAAVPLSQHKLRSPIQLAAPSPRLAKRSAPPPRSASSSKRKTAAHANLDPDRMPLPSDHSHSARISVFPISPLLLLPLVHPSTIDEQNSPHKTQFTYRSLKFRGYFVCPASSVPHHLSRIIRIIPSRLPRRCRRHLCRLRRTSCFPRWCCAGNQKSHYGRRREVRRMGLNLQPKPPR